MVYFDVNKQESGLSKSEKTYSKLGNVYNTTLALISNEC